MYSVWNLGELSRPERVKNWQPSNSSALDFWCCCAEALGYEMEERERL